MRRAAIAALAFVLIAASPGALIDAAVAALDARVAALEARVAELEAAPTPTPTPTPAPEPTVAPPTGGQQLVAGDITQPGLYSLNGQHVAGTVNVYADNVTIVGPGRIDFLALRGADDFLLTGGVQFGAGNETPIRVYWSPTGDPVRNAVFEQFEVVHTGFPANGKGYSSASSGPDGPVYHEGVTFRDCLIDQRQYGWGGIEVWKTHGLVIEGCEFRGNAGAGASIDAAISIPRSDGAVIRNNTFDLSEHFWGIELADVDDALVEGNTVTGIDDGRTWHAFVQMHPGSGQVLRNTIRGNTVSSLPALFNSHDAIGGLTVADNCLSGVPRLFWGPTPGSWTNTNNGACP
jgi:hypothetical protein